MKITLKKRSEKCAKKSRGHHKDRKGVGMELEVIAAEEEAKTTEAIEDSTAAKEDLPNTITSMNIIVVKLISLQKRLSILVKNLRTKNSNSA